MLNLLNKGKSQNILPIYHLYTIQNIHSTPNHTFISHTPATITIFTPATVPAPKNMKRIWKRKKNNGSEHERENKDGY